MYRMAFLSPSHLACCCFLFIKKGINILLEKHHLIKSGHKGCIEYWVQCYMYSVGSAAVHTNSATLSVIICTHTSQILPQRPFTGKTRSKVFWVFCLFSPVLYLGQSRAEVLLFFNRCKEFSQLRLLSTPLTIIYVPEQLPPLLPHFHYLYTCSQQSVLE